MKTVEPVSKNHARYAPIATLMPAALFFSFVLFAPHILKALGGFFIPLIVITVISVMVSIGLYVRYSIDTSESFRLGIYKKIDNAKYTKAKLAALDFIDKVVEMRGGEIFNESDRDKIEGIINRISDDIDTSKIKEELSKIDRTESP